VKRRRPTRGYRADSASSRCVVGVRSATFAIGLLLAGCTPGKASDPPALPIVATPIAPAPPAPPEPLVDDSPPALDAALVERVPEGTFGPYIGAAPNGRAVAVWAALTEAEGARWFSTVLDAKGVPAAPPRALGEAPSELSLASVAGGPSGFVVLASGTTPNGARIEALQLGPAGELVAGPTPLAYSRSDVLWVKALALSNANVALWATLAVGAADAYLAPLTPGGGQRAAPVRVLESAKAWQAAPFSDGVALAAIIAGASEAKSALTVSFFDSDGRRLGQTEIRGAAPLEDQVDAARIGENLIVTWIEREGADRRLYLAALGPDTRLIAPPEPATPPFARQRLHELLPASEPRGDGLLAWELVGQAPRGQQRLWIGRVSERGRLLAPAATWLSFSANADEGVELARRGKGLAALGRANACAPAASACPVPEPVPTFVELGPDLEPVASEPLRLAPEAGKTADLAWGLHCSADACSALAALPAAPVPIYGVDLRARSRAWPAAAHRSEPELPRALDVRTVSETDPLAELAAARIANRWLVASLTQFDDSTPYVRRTTPAPDGKLAPVRALLGVQVFSNEGRAEPPRIVSYRARAASGASLCRLNDERALLAWTALDQQRPEVFATLLGKDGASLTQRVLTKGAGDVTAVAAAPLARGSVVAWIADRDGATRLFAARLNDDLLRAAPEQRIGSASGYTALSLARRGDEAWLFAARRDEREEVLSLTRLDPKTAARRGDEVPIARSTTGSFASPVIVPHAGGALLAWVERPLVGGGETARAFLLELDAETRRLGEPVGVASAGDPIALRLFCEAGQCQGVLDARSAEGSWLEGFTRRSDGSSSARLLMYRTGAAADPPALALTDGAIFYADRSESGAMVRRATIVFR
jgi:hypothetical protein